MTHSYLYRLLIEIGVFFRTLWVERSLFEACHLVFILRTRKTYLKFYEFRKKNKLTFFNDFQFIQYLLIGYIGIAKFGIEISFYAFLGLQVLDILIRLVVTLGL